MNESATATDVIYNEMRDMIVRGELKPGARLVRGKLAKHFGTSAIPVLESIRRLERDGLVVSEPRWGTRVEEWSLDDIEAIFTIREGVEAMACRLFAQRAAKSELQALVEHGRRYDDAARAMDEEAVDREEVALHLHIIKCAGSRFLYRFTEMSSIISLAIKNYAAVPASPGEATAIPGDHDALIIALGSGDPDAAERASRQHVRNGFRTLMTRLQACSSTPELQSGRSSREEGGRA